MPLSAGLLRMLSGVSPCAPCQTISPLSRLMALMVAYGGFSNGRPWMVSVRKPPPPAAGGAAGFLGAGAASAPESVPAALTITIFWPARPSTYGRSVMPGGGGTSAVKDMQLLQP